MWPTASVSGARAGAHAGPAPGRRTARVPPSGRQRGQARTVYGQNPPVEIEKGPQPVGGGLGCPTITNAAHGSSDSTNLGCARSFSLRVGPPSGMTATAPSSIVAPISSASKGTPASVSPGRIARSSVRDARATFTPAMAPQMNQDFMTSEIPYPRTEVKRVGGGACSEGGREHAPQLHNSARKKRAARMTDYFPQGRLTIRLSASASALSFLLLLTQSIPNRQNPVWIAPLGARRKVPLSLGPIILQGRKRASNQSTSAQR